VAGASLCQAVVVHSKHLGPEQQQSLVGALSGASGLTPPHPAPPGAVPRPLL